MSWEEPDFGERVAAETVRQTVVSKLSSKETEVDCKMVLNSPVVWACEFAARTVLLDCGGLWAFGDVLVDTGG